MSDKRKNYKTIYEEKTTNSGKQRKVVKKIVKRPLPQSALANKNAKNFVDDTQSPRHATNDLTNYSMNNELNTVSAENSRLESSRNEDSRVGSSRNEDSRVGSSRNDDSRAELSRADDSRAELSRAEDSKIDDSKAEENVLGDSEITASITLGVIQSEKRDQEMKIMDNPNEVNQEEIVEHRRDEMESGNINKEGKLEEEEKPAEENVAVNMPFKPLRRNQALEEAKPAEEVQTFKEVEATQEVKREEEVKPVEEVRHVEEAKPVQMIRPVRVATAVGNKAEAVLEQHTEKESSNPESNITKKSENKHEEVKPVEEEEVRQEEVAKPIKFKSIRVTAKTENLAESIPVQHSEKESSNPESKINQHTENQPVEETKPEEEAKVQMVRPVRVSAAIENKAEAVLESSNPESKIHNQSETKPEEVKPVEETKPNEEEVKQVKIVRPVTVLTNIEEKAGADLDKLSEYEFVLPQNNIPENHPKEEVSHPFLSKETFFIKEPKDDLFSSAFNETKPLEASIVHNEIISEVASEAQKVSADQNTKLILKTEEYYPLLEIPAEDTDTKEEVKTSSVGSLLKKYGSAFVTVTGGVLISVFLYRRFKQN